MKQKEKDELKAIVQLNKACFGQDDYYSSAAYVLHMVHLEDGVYFSHRDPASKEVVGYIMITVKDGVAHCSRRGVLSSARSSGLGTKLTRKAIKWAHNKGLDYQTYTALDNYASMNSNIKAGCKVKKVDENWVTLVCPAPE